MTMPTAVNSFVTSSAAAGFTSTSARSLGQFLTGLIGVVWALGLVLGFPTALAILGAVGFAAVIIGIFRPAIGLFGASMLCVLDAPMRIFILKGGLLRWNSYSYWLLIVVVLFAPTIFRWRDPHTRLLQWLLAVLLIGLVISARFVVGVQHVFGILAVFGLMVYFYRAASVKGMLYWTGIVCGALAAGGSFVLMLQSGDLPIYNRNVMSFFPLTGVFAVTLAFADRRQPRDQTLFMLMALNFLAVFLTGSRGGMLIAVVCALYVTARMQGLGTRVVAVVVGALLIVGATAVFSDLQTVAIERVERLFDPAKSGRERTSGRGDLVVGGWYIFLEHPVTGVGTGAFQKAWADLGKREGMSAFMRGREFSAHAGWIKVLGENGFVGFVLLFAYVFSFLAVGLRSKNRDVRMLGALATLVLSVTLMTHEFEEKGLWFFVAGATMLLHRPRTRYWDVSTLEEADAHLTLESADHD